MVWMCLAALGMCLFVVVLYSALIVASDADDAMEIREERVMTPEVTPVPMPEELTVTYPVPLDQELQDYIVETALANQVSPALVFAVIGVESGYDATKKGDFWDGHYHSFGLMQILASEHTERCLRLNAYNLLDPYQNVRVGIDFLAELLETGNTVDECLTFYNTGYWQEPNDYARTVLCNAEQIMEGVMISRKGIRNES